MEHSLKRIRCASMISLAISAIFEATENAREARMVHRVTDLENIAEELIYLHRQVLDLPPQSSTALASEEDGLPF